MEADKQVEIAGHRVSIRYKRVKNLNMRLQDDGSVHVSAPRRVSLLDISRFVSEKSDWIEKNAAKLKARQKPPLQFTQGAMHALWGQEYRLHITEVKRGRKVTFDGTSWQMAVQGDASDDIKAALMEAAYQDLLLQAAAPMQQHWAAHMGLEPQQLKTQKMTSRWGSCHTGKGVIKLNSELARRPLPMLEYVLVHELVHLWERGHNARFYSFMDRYLPDWRSRKQQLNGLLL